MPETVASASPELPKDGVTLFSEVLFGGRFELFGKEYCPKLLLLHVWGKQNLVSPEGSLPLELASASPAGPHCALSGEPFPKDSATAWIGKATWTIFTSGVSSL